MNEKKYQQFRDLSRNWTQITCLAVRLLNHYTRMFLCLCEAAIQAYSCMDDSVSHSNHYTRMFLCFCEAAIQAYSCMDDSVSHSNHYTRMFSVLVWGCNSTLFMDGWTCPIHLIYLIGRKSLHFEKKLDCSRSLRKFLCWDFLELRYTQECIPVGCIAATVNRMTDRCKNITLPQSSFAGGNYLWEIRTQGLSEQRLPELDYWV